MRKALLSITCFTLFCLVIGSTLGAGQASSALQLNAYVGDSLVYKISTKLNNQNLTVDYMRIQIGSITNFGGYVEVYGSQWRCSEEAYKNSSANLNVSTNLVTTNLKVAYLLNEPSNDLIVKFNWVWKKDAKVETYLDQLSSYVDNTYSTTKYSYAKYGLQTKGISTTANGNGYIIAIKNDTTTLESYSRIYSNTGFLTTYDEFLIEYGRIKYEIIPEASTGLISLEDLPYTLGLTYGITLFAGIIIGAFITRLAEKKRPKLAADI